MPFARSRRGGLGLWLLLYQVFGLHRIPPATLIIASLQCLVFLRVIRVPWQGVRDVCISVDKVWAQKEYHRLFVGAFEHMDDFHLYYNMISFLLKGITLERLLGSGKFFYTVSILTLSCNLTLVALSKLASVYVEEYYYYQCSVGFSGVIFALKVLTTHYWPQIQPGRLMGLPIDIPARYMVWAELLLIQAMVPNASFVGHLAGILVGLGYVHTPLKTISDEIWTVLASFLFATPPIPRRHQFQEAFGVREDEFQTPFAQNPIYGDVDEDYYRNGRNLPYPIHPQNHQFPQPDFHPMTGLSEEEQLQRAIETSLRENNSRASSSEGPDSYSMRSERLQYPSAPPHFEDDFNYNDVPDGNDNRGGLYPDLEELRRRRADNYY